MEPVRPVTVASPASGFESLARPVPPSAGDREPERQGLDPAVSIELTPGAEKADPEKRGYERDRDSKALVFRITDALSGDIIVQIPDEIVIKARAYTWQPAATVGERIEKTV